ncbi:MAG: hypothetical protein U0587_01885 [Candidatus Binatia bacterium]
MAHGGRRAGRARRGLHRLLAVAALLAVAVCSARADVASDQAAAIVVFPKLRVDTNNVAGKGRVDTLIRVSNTSSQSISLRCFYADATPVCSNGSGSCLAPGACTGVCVPQWQETDFVVNITALQPIAWLASQGAAGCEESLVPGMPCFPLTTAGGRIGPNGQTNNGSRIPPAPEDPFIGELKCVAVDRNDVPVERNDLKGEVQIVRADTSPFSGADVETYNAIGIPSIPGTNNGDNTLILGGNVCAGGANAKSICSTAADCPGGSCVSAAEYSGCPNILILDHFFDGATDPISGLPVTTDLTLVPCSEDFLNQAPLTTPVQFLVFNEFEQRFSTSRRITCFQEFRISDIDTHTPTKSIFSAAVNGTLTGQTRMRGVADQDTDHGHAILGVAEEFRDSRSSAAVNLHFTGSRPQSDFVYLP